MSYRRLNTFLSVLITGVLVHYSVAWAVLDCFHIDEPDTEMATSTGANPFSLVLSNHLKTNIQCIGFEYRIEPLAASSAPNQLSSVTGDIASQMDGLSSPYHRVEIATTNLWLSALFERDSSLIFPISLPRYLRLSGLRI